MLFAISVIIAAAAVGILVVLNQDKRKSPAKASLSGGWHVELWHIQHGYPVNLEFSSSMVVGRNALCNTAANLQMIPVDRTISREHILLYGQSGSLWIWNMSEVNPVLVNGTRLNSPQRLLPGEQLKLGDSVFLVTRVDHC